MTNGRQIRARVQFRDSSWKTIPTFSKGSGNGEEKMSLKDASETRAKFRRLANPLNMGWECKKSCVGRSGTMSRLYYFGTLEACK